MTTGSQAPEIFEQKFQTIKKRARVCLMASRVNCVGSGCRGLSREGRKRGGESERASERKGREQAEVVSSESGPFVWESVPHPQHSTRSENPYWSNTSLLFTGLCC